MSDTVTVTAAEGAELEIMVGETEIQNEGTASWSVGSNTLSITVTEEDKEPTTYTVTVTRLAASALTGLTVGALTLSPSFDASVLTYTTTTNNATNKVTATAAEGAELEIKVGDTEIENESSATWAVGENTLTVKVTENGKAPTTYTVTVTKSE